MASLLVILRDSLRFQKQMYEKFPKKTASSWLIASSQQLFHLCGVVFVTAVPSGSTMNDFCSIQFSAAERPSKESRFKASTPK